MIFNWFLAGLGNTRSIFLPTILKLSLGNPAVKAISRDYPQIEYCLVINQNFKLVILSRDVTYLSSKDCLVNTKKAIVKKWHENYLKRLNLKTFGCSSLQNAFKSPESLLNLAKNNLELRIIKTFIAHLHHPNSLQQEIIANLTYSRERISIKIISSFNISAVKRSELISTIEKTIAAEAEVQFDLVTNAKSIIELHTNKFKIHWNLKQYFIEVPTAPLLSDSQTAKN